MCRRVDVVCLLEINHLVPNTPYASQLTGFLVMGIFVSSQSQEQRGELMAAFCNAVVVTENLWSEDGKKIAVVIHFSFFFHFINFFFCWFNK